MLGQIQAGVHKFDLIFSSSYYSRSVYALIKYLYVFLGPSSTLGSKRPLGSLVAAKNIIPLLLQIIICASVQILAMYYLFLQPWFVPIPVKTIEPVIVSWENTVVFTVSCYQYIILATVYSKGKPFRQMLITNFWFVLSAITLTICVTWLLLYPCKFVSEWMEVKSVEHDHHEQRMFRYMLMIFPIAHIFLAAFIEVRNLSMQFL